MLVFPSAKFFGVSFSRQPADVGLCCPHAPMLSRKKFPRPKPPKSLELGFSISTREIPRQDTMAPEYQENRKRKAVTRDVAEEPSISPGEELGNGALDGVLSQSDDESDDDAGSIAFSSDEGSAFGSEDEEDAEDIGDEDSEDLTSISDADEQEQEGGLVKSKVGRTDSAVGALSNGAKTNGQGDLGDDGADKPNYRVTTDANGNERYVYDEIDPAYASDDSDAPPTTNTIGNIPLSFYDSYPHIGYDINGKKVMRPAKGEALDALLDSIEVPKGWTGLTDPNTGKPLQLSQSELEILRKVQMDEIPEEGFDPYPATVEWFTSKQEIMPLSAAPEPKRRFVPSKHEAKRVMKIVRAIREGRIMPYKPPNEEEEEQREGYQSYDLWANEEARPDHPMNIPAPKLPPPGYEESYHPPPEYLPDENERKAWEEQDEEDRDKDFLPRDHTALRRVPGYEQFVKEKFERCLDLYLAPRVRRKKLNIDPESLLPKLPNPDELRPFPTSCAALFRGHQGRVRSLAIDPSGVWLASGGDDGTVRVWEILTAKQLWSVKLSSDEAVTAVRWRPGKDAVILAAATGESIYLATPLNLINPEIEAASREVLDAGWGYATTKPSTNADGAPKEAAAEWARPERSLSEEGVLVQVILRKAAKVIDWHRRGEYFSTVSPSGQTSAVAIHTLSKHLTQLPFRRLKGLAQTAQFHPSKPIFFVATQRNIRSYDLSQQKLLKIIQPGARWISSFDVHPGGDNLIVGSYDKRLLWHDLDLSVKPYKTLRYHQKAIRAVKFHQGGLPLFADASDDGSLQIFHGRVVGDMMENATIVPLKVLKGHQVKGELGVLDLDWHPREAWCVSAGADGTCRLWT